MTDRKRCPRCTLTLDVTPENYGMRTRENGRITPRGLCRPCERKNARAALAAKPYNDRLAYNREWNRSLRMQALAAYADDPERPACACCGESHERFLALDHINDDGAASRRRERYRGDIYRRLRREGWPQGELQILCCNCNWAKAQGGCPHGNPAGQPGGRFEEATG